MSAFWETGRILHVLAGSRAYGLATAESDTDTRGVCIPPVEYLLGLSEFEQHESAGGDHVVYALGKFVRLALQGNPNILETLWVDAADVLFADGAGRALLAARESFLSKQVGRRFSGYALAQLRRLERHHRWLVEPPPGRPAPEAFGARRMAGRVRFPDVEAQKAHDAALKHWRHYETWRRERNPARAALEERHGYDTKHAMHLLRILKMGEEVLARGELSVRRRDAQWLLGVRDGALSYAELMARASALEARVEHAMARSPLPDEPDRAAAQALVVRLHLDSLGSR